ncbi:hypothetical protein LY85_2591 [Clostridium sp. KNHs216]|nr:hypothetical protein LY85_2591 [Clostridium sp. KNHs216]
MLASTRYNEDITFYPKEGEPVPICFYDPDHLIIEVGENMKSPHLADWTVDGTDYISLNYEITTRR